MCVCVCSGYSCHSHPRGSAPWSLKGAGQDQNGFPHPHPLALGSCQDPFSTECLLGVSSADPPKPASIRAFAHFTEEEMEAGRDATS